MCIVGLTSRRVLLVTCQRDAHPTIIDSYLSGLGFERTQVRESTLPDRRGLEQTHPYSPVPFLSGKILSLLEKDLVFS